MATKLKKELRRMKEKASKEAAVNHDPSRQYYFNEEYTELTKKSLIPFVYNSEPITTVNRQLMSKPR